MTTHNRVKRDFNFCSYNTACYLEITQLITNLLINNCYLLNP